MSSQLDQLQFGFARRVPDGCIPLSYINIPIPDVGQHLKLVGTGKYTIDNRDGLYLKNMAPSITLSQKNITNSLSVSGIITSNKLLDPSFLYGFVPSVGASWTSNYGTWDWKLTGGRTSLNSTYDTGEEPAREQGASAQPTCAYVDWSNGTSYAEIASTTVDARPSGAEGGYSMDNVVYQAGFG